MKILVVRNDKVGDLALAWPALAVLKHYIPESYVSLLVQNYTLSLAELCPWLDELITDDQLSAEMISEKSFDAVIALRSSKQVAYTTWAGRIPYRLAPATKWWQFFYNIRHIQRRSSSAKPEYAYNIDLIYRLLHDWKCTPELLCTLDHDGDYLPAVVKRPLLAFSESEIHITKERLFKNRGGTNKTQIIMIHPSSGGSANNLTGLQYTYLISELYNRCNWDIKFLISIGPAEEEICAELASNLRDIPHDFIVNKQGIDFLARNIACCDLFISNSTGPLHIAGLLNCDTVGFYPRHRSGSPLRWQTLNVPSKRLVFTPPEGSDPKIVSSIHLDTVIDEIIEKYSHLYE